MVFAARISQFTGTDVLLECQQLNLVFMLGCYSA